MGAVLDIKTYFKILLLMVLIISAPRLMAQVMEEDTTTNQPFFKASKFNSKCYVALEGAATQILKHHAGMTTGISLNWVINHKYVVSAKYYVLGSPVNVQSIVASDKPTTTINLFHQYAGLAFSYVAFSDKKFSLQPEISAGWGMVKYNADSTVHGRKDFAEIIPAIYGTYNVTKYFRFGVGLNYRATIGAKVHGLNDADVSGVSGIIFIKIGTF